MILTIGLVFLILIGLLLDAIYTAHRFQYTDQGKYLEVDDFKVFYQQQGAGKDIVFIHGIGASHHIWRDVSPILAKQSFRSTLIDLPGFGRSSKIRFKSYSLDAQTERLYKILEKLELTSIFIVGSSMGGTLALYLAKSHPDLVSKIIVIGPATNPKLVPLPFYRWPQFSYLLKFFNNRILMNIVLRIILNNYSVINSSRIAYSLKNQHEDPYATYTFLKATEALDDPRMPQIFSQIQQAVIILYGKKDRMVPAKYIFELQNTLPHSQVIFHETGGHHLMEDDPAWVAKQLIKFFEK
ncbi:MAG: alpha/beta hydrolase [Bdellovibrionaceae bacterium]|nr:alpha/beta hydrolase [Pseudobdellovibrionaceae bacterium]